MPTLNQSRVTVPVTCPNCMHQGPAYLYLLGKMSRCKVCKYDFKISAIVRMSCPGCLARLRVPADAVGRSVECNFCTRTFVASPDRARVKRLRARTPDLDDLFLVQHVQASPHILEGCLSDDRQQVNGTGTNDQQSLWNCPGEHAVFVLPSVSNESLAASMPASPQPVLNPAMTGEVIDQSERVQSLEQALSTLTSEYDQLRAELRTVRTESQQSLRQELAEIEAVRQQELRDLETLRGRLIRLEECRSDGATDPDRDRDRTHVPSGRSSPTIRSAMPSVYTRGSGPNRPAQAKPGVAKKSPGGRQVIAHNGHAASPLREIMDRVSSCESIIDRLISRLKSALDAREQDRAAYEQIIKKLESEIARVREELVTSSCFGAEALG